MKIAELTTEAIYEGINKTSSELAIMNHETGYNNIAVKIEGGEIVDFWCCETTDGYFRAENWSQIAKFGTGSCACNCDACTEGEDPKEWAGDEAGNIDEYLAEMIEQFVRDFHCEN